MRNRFLALLTILSRPAVALGGSVLIGVAVIAFAWYSTQVAPSGVDATVTRGPIQQEVDVSGTVKAAQTTDLSFQIPGQVARTPVAIGDHVAAGQVLVALNGGSQSAALALAQANLEVQQANLASLQAGTRPEQLALDQTAASQGLIALANAEENGYVSADTAVHSYADQTFINPRGNALLAILVSDSLLANRVQAERIALEPMFVSWQAALASASSSPESVALTSETNLKTVSVFLNDLSTALAEAQPSSSISAATIAGYQASVNTGRAGVSAALIALTAADTAAQSAAGSLTLAQAGATTNSLDAQKAQVDAAQAAVDAAQVAASETVITAPVSGTITVQNANLGETVVPGVPLVSLIADGKFEADAAVSQNDIGNVRLGASAPATFDAYPGVTFPTVVTTVGPAASMDNGVASYTVTVTFSDSDPRVRPGLTANLHILSATSTDALTVPASAVIKDGTAAFVYLKSANGSVKTPVTLGIENASGMTQIINGLTQGEQVLTFGAAAN